MRLIHFVIAITVTVALSFVGIAVYTYTQFKADDALMDYSSLDVDLGPRDAEINGYSKLRKITDSMQWSFGRYDDENIAMSPFYPEPNPLSIEELRAIVAANAENVAAIEDALAMELFQFDQDPTPDTLVPEIGQFQSFARNQVFHARLLALEGNPDAALAKLITLSQQIKRFADSQSCLVSLLTAAANAKICNDEIDYLAMHYPLSANAIRHALDGYALRGALEPNLAVSIKLEFQFCVYCIDHLGEMAEDESDSIFPWPGKSQPNPLVFKPNRTKNEFYVNYADAVEQLALPSNQRHFVWADKIERERNKGFLPTLLSGNAVGTIMQSILVPAFDKVYPKAAQRDFNSEATYLMLAIRLYQMNHGALPPTLDALVPGIIDAVPIDPFDGQPLRYNAERAVIYSIGEDGEDQGGSEFVSRIDYDAPDYREMFDDGEIAEQDQNEPTYHVRFNLKPRSFTPDTEKQP